MKNWELMLNRESFEKRLAELKSSGREVKGVLPKKFPVAICPRLSTDPKNAINLTWTFRGTLFPQELDILIECLQQKAMTLSDVEEDIWVNSLDSAKHYPDHCYIEELN